MSFERHAESASSLLHGASPGLVSVMDTLARRIDLPKGRILFQKGDIGDSLYLLEDGLIDISVVSEDGRRLCLNLLSPGEIFGEIALFDVGPRTANAEAHVDCRLRQVRRPELLAELAKTPDLAFEMIALAGRRMRWMSAQYEDRVMLTTEARLARKLLFLAGRTPGGEEVMTLSQSDLSDHMGLTREIVSRNLTAWRQRGWIEIKRGQVRVLEGEAILQMSDNVSE